MTWLVTGGAGFIGTNLVSHLSQSGSDVVVLDDLSRSGVAENAEHLRKTFGTEICVLDVAEQESVNRLFRSRGPFEAVAHLAGQVSLMASIADPVRDFEVNARGTLNVLEAAREYSPDATVIGMASNKVYGDLRSVRIDELENRYVAPDYPNGFGEDLPLDFHGPYGCSKGTADQYLLDYNRIYGLRTFSLRQSSVYGPFQHPQSDQGWVGFLVGEARAGRPIALNGEGKQVRDLLHVADLAALFPLLAAAPPAGAGCAFNVGGGPERALSILQLFERLAVDHGIHPEFTTGPLRPSDQLVFVSDNTSVRGTVPWEPRVALVDGIEELVRGHP
jgi:CDP-paratose 2-epimerase